MHAAARRYSGLPMHTYIMHVLRSYSTVRFKLVRVYDDTGIILCSPMKNAEFPKGIRP